MGSRSLSILSLADSFFLPSADAVGGLEQILFTLDCAITRAGHVSRVIAPAAADAIARALEQQAFDLIHLHALRGTDLLNALPAEGPPALVTLHSGLDRYPELDRWIGRERFFFNCTNRVEVGELGRCKGWLGSVENGVRLEEFHPPLPGRRKMSFGLCLGRIGEEKGFHLALAAAHRASQPLLVAGCVPPLREHQDYFADRIVPQLDRRRRFLGAVGARSKRRLLSWARCLLVPSTDPEIDSLAALEALACGTPVVAFARGAMRELIEDGRTGFLVEAGCGARLAQAWLDSSQLSAEDCRGSVRSRFDAQRMTARYLEIYQQIAAGAGG